MSGTKRLRLPFALARKFLRGVFLKRIREVDKLTELDMAREAVSQAETLVKIKKEFPELTKLLEHKLGKALLVFNNLDDNDPHLERKLIKLHGEIDMLLNGLILEKVAKMAWGTLMLDAHRGGIPDSLLNKHFRRKHGPDAYYGQNKKGEKK